MANFLSSIVPTWAVNMVTNLGIYFALMLVAYAAITYVRKQGQPFPDDYSTSAYWKRLCVFGPGDAGTRKCPRRMNREAHRSPVRRRDLAGGESAAFAGHAGTSAPLLCWRSPHLVPLVGHLSGKDSKD